MLIKQVTLQCTEMQKCMLRPGELCDCIKEKDPILLLYREITITKAICRETNMVNEWLEAMASGFRSMRHSFVTAILCEL